MTCTNLSPLGPLLGARSQRVAGGDAAPGSLGCSNGAGISSVCLCQQRPGGRDPAPPPAAPGTSWEERAGNPWPQGRCTCRGLQEPRSLWQEEAIPTAGPAPRTVRPALIRPWLHTNPPNSPQGRDPEPLGWGRGRCWLAQEGPGWRGARCLWGGAARGAKSPPARAADISVGTREGASAFYFPLWRCDVRALVCRDCPGPSSGRWGCEPGRGALLSAPPGSSLVAGIVPSPPKDFMTDVLSCF